MQPLLRIAVVGTEARGTIEDLTGEFRIRIGDSPEKVVWSPAGGDPMRSMEAAFTRSVTDLACAVRDGREPPVTGTDAIRYWDDSISDWADITGAMPDTDYTLAYIDDSGSDLYGYTVLTVWAIPEPGTILMLLLGVSMLLARRRRCCPFLEIRWTAGS